jgi:iron complex transport system substrate-binding protein
MKKQFLLLSFILFVGMAGFMWFNIRGNNVNPPMDITTVPQRIVSLAPDITEILFAMGLGDKIVAVSSDSDYPPAATTKSKVGSFWQPNTEAIIATKPDLVITLSFEQQKNVAESLNRLGYRILTVKTDQIEELWTAISQIGSATGCYETAKQLIESIKNRLNSIKLKYSNTDKVKVLWVIQAEPLRLAGRSTFINELIELAGGENAIGPTIQQYPEISTEQLLVCGAQVIIQSSMDSDNIEKQQEAAKLFWSKYPNLPAVKNNQIYVIDSDTVLRLGPRLPEGLEMIARYLHQDK